MKRKRFMMEQIIRMLREAGVHLYQGTRCRGRCKVAILSGAPRKPGRNQAENACILALKASELGGRPDVNGPSTIKIPGPPKGPQGNEGCRSELLGG